MSKIKETKGNQLQTAVMDFEADAKKHGSDMNRDDLQLPILRVLQDKSKALKTVDGAKPGMLFNTVTEDLFDGAKGVTVIVCAYKREYLEWEPYSGESKAPVQTYSSSSDILTKTKKDASNRDVLPNNNYIATTMNYYVLVQDEKGFVSPAYLSMTGSALKKARRWNSVMMQVQIKKENGDTFNPPAFSQKYKLSTFLEEGKMGSYWNYDISHIGSLSEKEASLYSQAKAFRESVMSGEVSVKDDEVSPNANTEEPVPF